MSAAGWTHASASHETGAQRDSCHRSLRCGKGCNRVTFSIVEAATKKRTTDDLAIKIGAFMLRCMGGRSSEVFRVLDESGITFSQMKVLVELEAADEDARTVTALSEELGISAASASRAADGLVRKKLATRVEDADDRRVRRLAATEKGRDLADRIISARLAGLEEFSESLDRDERQKLEAALDALLQRPEIAEIYSNYERKVRR
jgi:DNA-binding MarR family transcriptional regulator